MSERGLLIVISGPSGVGKGTVVQRLLPRLRDPYLSVSATTRPPRRGEVDGVDYRFLDRTTFDDWARDGALLEWAEYAGNRYGTPRADVEQQLAAGRDVILEIEVQGALQVRESDRAALLVFLTPPSLAELERRLTTRGTESPEARDRRLVVARAELGQRDAFDHVVVNDEVDRAVDEIVDLVEVARGAEPHAH